MVLLAKVEPRRAQEVKQWLRDRNLIDQRFRAFLDQDSFFIPVVQHIAELDIVQRPQGELETHEDRVTPKELLNSSLTPQELDSLKLAFDTVGDIAIIEVDEALVEKQDKIAKAILSATPQIKTVVKKVGHHAGTFRVQAVEVLAGNPTTITEHKENGVRLTLDVGQVYFSPRLSTERKRISGYVTSGEEVLVMFSGCAPYVCVLAKNTEAKDIIGIEINPKGHEYGLKNIALNKIKNATLYQGDVRDVVPTLKQTFDRIIMPLPKTSEEFLDTALQASKAGTIIHLYAFMKEEELEAYYQTIKEIMGERSYTIERTIKCGQQSPHTYRFCIDIKVND